MAYLYEAGRDDVIAPGVEIEKAGIAIVTERIRSKWVEGGTKPPGSVDLYAVNVFPTLVNFNHSPCCAEPPGT